MDKVLTHISLFSGAGISDWGFHRAGWECVAQVEIDKQATAVRKRHFPNDIHHEDIRNFDAKPFRGVRAIAGGFPCQDYSVAGKRAGLAGDRGALWWEFHRCIREAMPELVIGENVPGILSSDGGRSFGTIVGSLVELGYRVSWRVLDLRYFRVPQRRRRVFIVGSLGTGRSAEILFEPKSLCRDTPQGREAGEEVAGTLGGGSGVRGWRNDLDSVGAYVPSFALQGGGSTSQGSEGAGWKSDESFTLNTTDVHGVVHTLRGEGFDASEDGTGRGTPLVATTLTAGGNPNSNMPGRHREDDENIVAFNWQSGGDCRGLDPTTNTHALHCEQTPATFNGQAVRRLTPRECERLMGLPDDFTRYAADGTEMADAPRYRMLGNGWSVPQAEWIARRAKQVLTLREDRI